MTAAVIFWHMVSRFVKSGAGLLLNNYRKDKIMYLIAGLGNPTREYEKTRHNVGFSVIDVLADKYNIDVSDRKHKALCGKGVIEGEKVLLVKPQTFMNLSGESIRERVVITRSTRRISLSFMMISAWIRGSCASG